MMELRRQNIRIIFALKRKKCSEEQARIVWWILANRPISIAFRNKDSFFYKKKTRKTSKNCTLRFNSFCSYRERVRMIIRIKRCTEFSCCCHLNIVKWYHWQLTISLTLWVSHWFSQRWNQQMQNQNVNILDTFNCTL